MPQTQSLQLSSKATVQQAGVILGQVCVLEGLENLVDRPARNTRNAKGKLKSLTSVHTETSLRTKGKGEKSLPLSLRPLYF